MLVPARVVRRPWPARRASRVEFTGYASPPGDSIIHVKQEVELNGQQEEDSQERRQGHCPHQGDHQQHAHHDHRSQRRDALRGFRRTVGFKGARKSTPFAASRASEKCGSKARRFGMREVEVHVTGPGPGRESAVTALQASGLKVAAIEDHTPIPFNGCRAAKRRRV